MRVTKTPFLTVLIEKPVDVPCIHINIAMIFQITRIDFDAISALYRDESSLTSEVEKFPPVAENIDKAYTDSHVADRVYITLFSVILFMIPGHLLDLGPFKVVQIMNVPGVTLQYGFEKL